MRGDTLYNARCCDCPYAWGCECAPWPCACILAAGPWSPTSFIRTCVFNRSSSISSGRPGGEHLSRPSLTGLLGLCLSWPLPLPASFSDYCPLCTPFLSLSRQSILPQTRFPEWPSSASGTFFLLFFIFNEILCSIHSTRMCSIL